MVDVHHGYLPRKKYISNVIKDGRVARFFRKMDRRKMATVSVRIIEIPCNFDNAFHGSWFFIWYF